VVVLHFRLQTTSGKFNMEDWALWYAFNCPLSRYTGIRAAKQGITSHPAVRLGVYQNSVSRDNHISCFEMTYIGSRLAVSNLEKAVIREYNWAIERDGRGHSEWISGLAVSDIESAIDKLISENHFKVKKVEINWLPLTTENLEEFLKHHNLN
jgi:hypothetical protein